jgi:putative component of toxin-antitoxin plasmid stabilization module
MRLQFTRDFLEWHSSLKDKKARDIIASRFVKLKQAYLEIQNL